MTSTVDRIETIATHDGTFHCDDALAAYMLLLIYPEAKIIRTRDKDELQKADIVFDVGSEFDHAKRRYDHHQRGFNETFNSLDSKKKWKTKLSSAGLVYFYYGRNVLQIIVEKLSKKYPNIPKLTSEEHELIYDQIYANFIEEIDAVDNGIHATEEEPRYLITTTISKRVALCNPLWNEDSSPEELMRRFKRAMEMVGGELEIRVDYYVRGWLTARSQVKQAIDDRFNVDRSGEIMILSQSGLPWKEYIFNLEQELEVETPIKYVVYEEKKDKWKCQCVPLKYDSFDNRLTLPKEWRALEHEQLCEVTGIEGCIFVHPNGFTAANKTKGGAMKMARSSLKQ